MVIFNFNLYKILSILIVINTKIIKNNIKINI